MKKIVKIPFVNFLPYPAKSLSLFVFFLFFLTLAFLASAAPAFATNIYLRQVVLRNGHLTEQRDIGLSPTEPFDGGSGTYGAQPNPNLANPPDPTYRYPGNGFTGSPNTPSTYWYPYDLQVATGYGLPANGTYKDLSEYNYLNNGQTYIDQTLVEADNGVVWERKCRVDPNTGVDFGSCSAFFNTGIVWTDPTWSHLAEFTYTDGGVTYLHQTVLKNDGHTVLNRINTSDNKQDCTVGSDGSLNCSGLNQWKSYDLNGSRGLPGNSGYIAISNYAHFVNGQQYLMTQLYQSDGSVWWSDCQIGVGNDGLCPAGELGYNFTRYGSRYPYYGSGESFGITESVYNSNQPSIRAVGNYLLPPTNLQSTCYTSGQQVTFSWNPVLGAEHYILRFNADPQSDWMGPGDFTVGLSGTTFTTGTNGDLWNATLTSESADTHLNPGVRYVITLQAAINNSAEITSPQVGLPLNDCPTPVPSATPVPSSTPTPTTPPPGTLIITALDPVTGKNVQNISVNTTGLPQAVITLGISGVFNFPNLAFGTSYSLSMPTVNPNPAYFDPSPASYSQQSIGGSSDCSKNSGGCTFKFDTRCDSNQDGLVSQQDQSKSQDPTGKVQSGQNDPTQDADYIEWNREFFGNGKMIVGSTQNPAADCDGDGTVSLNDFNLWRNLYYGIAGLPGEVQ